MQAAVADGSFEVRHPRTGQAVRSVSATELLAHITEAAWLTGDPGLLFLDVIARANPTPAVGPIEATNPCGEVPLLPYEACNLGSINLSHMVRHEPAGYTVAWDQLASITRLGIRFLDDVIEVGRWPAPQIPAIVRANRKIGLGVMGFAELLILLEIPYGSDRAVALAEELMRLIAEEGRIASEELASERGVFPNWERSIYARQGLRVRNAMLTSIAPTGTLSIIANTAASVEPLFALAYRRENVLGEQTLVELNPLFLQYAREKNFTPNGW